MTQLTGSLGAAASPAAERTWSWQWFLGGLFGCLVHLLASSVVWQATGAWWAGTAAFVALLAAPAAPAVRAGHGRLAGYLAGCLVTVVAAYLAVLVAAQVYFQGFAG